MTISNFLFKKRKTKHRNLVTKHDFKRPLGEEYKNEVVRGLQSVPLDKGVPPGCYYYYRYFIQKANRRPNYMLIYKLKKKQTYTYHIKILHTKSI